MNRKWRLIEWGTYDAYVNMAIDETLALTAKKTNIPIIRLGYKWQKPGAVSLGINQNCKKANRRTSIISFSRRFYLLCYYKSRLEI